MGQITCGRPRAIKVNADEHIVILGSQAESPGDLLKTVWLALASELCRWRTGKLEYISTPCHPPALGINLPELHSWAW